MIGFLRLFFAVVVAADHTNFKLFGTLPFGGDGTVPVGCFLLISGFYMALILKRKYSAIPGGTRLFYLNRILRIYPAYILVVCLTFGMMFLDGKTTISYWAKAGYWDQPAADFFSKLDGFDFLGQLSVWLSNIFIFGSNYLIDLGFQDDGSLTKTLFGPGITPGHAFLFFPPAWTLGIELTFYALAPLLMWRRPILVISAFILAIFYIPSFVEVIAGPFGIALVCCPLGMLAFFVYERLPTAAWVHALGYVMTIVIVGAFFVSNSLDVAAQLKYYGVLMLVLISIPFLFTASRSSRIDRIIGELSYPAYLLQLLTYKILAYTVGIPSMAPVYYPVLIAFSALMTFGLDLPLDKYRQRLVMKRASQRHDEPSRRKVVAIP